MNTVLDTTWTLRIADGAPVEVLQITDTHLFASAGKTLYGVNTEASLTDVLASIAAHGGTPDAVLATGDLSQDGSRASYLRLKEKLAALGAPVYCLPGNHDDPALMSELLGMPPFHYTGVLDAGSWRLPLLSSWLDGETRGALGVRQMAALAALLDRSGDRHVLVCVHHHPVPMASAWIDTIGLEDGDELLSLLHGYPNVQGVLWGHVHQALDANNAGLRLFATPSTCAQASNFSSSKPRCTWALMKPGKIVDPWTSIICASSGTFTSARGPTAIMRPSWITSVASGSGSAPVPSIRVPLTKARILSLSNSNTAVGRVSGFAGPSPAIIFGPQPAIIKTRATTTSK